MAISDWKRRFYGPGSDAEAQFLKDCYDSGVSAADLLAIPRLLAEAGPPISVTAATNSATYASLAGNGVAAALVASEEVAMPIWVPDTRTLTSVSINVTTLGATSAVRLGIREDAGRAYAYPGTLIADAGTQATTSTGTKTWSGLARALTPYTIYWLTFTEQGGTPPSVTCWNSQPWGQVMDSASFSGRGYKQTGVTGALGTFSATVSVSASATPRPVLSFT